MLTCKLEKGIRKGALLAAAAAACALGAATHVAHGQNPSPSTIFISTPNGRFLTAVNGGGIGGPNSGTGSAAIHTDAKYAQPGQWETFTCISVGQNKMAFQTYNGNFVTAVNGGGIGGPNANPYEVHTDATKMGPWEQFTIVSLPNGKCALRTSNGYWVTAVNGGGWGEPANQYPIHTDAKQIGPWETFGVTYLSSLLR